MFANPILQLIVVWALCVYGLYLAEQSALLPRPKLVVQGGAVAVAIISLYLLLQRV